MKMMPQAQPQPQYKHILDLHNVEGSLQLMDGMKRAGLSQKLGAGEFGYIFAEKANATGQTGACAHVENDLMLRVPNGFCHAQGQSQEKLARVCVKIPHFDV